MFEPAIIYSSYPISGEDFNRILKDIIGLVKSLYCPCFFEDFKRILKETKGNHTLRTRQQPTRGFQLEY